MEFQKLKDNWNIQSEHLSQINPAIPYLIHLALGDRLPNRIHLADGVRLNDGTFWNIDRYWLIRDCEHHHHYVYMITCILLLLFLVYLLFFQILFSAIYYFLFFSQQKLHFVQIVWGVSKWTNTAMMACYGCAPVAWWLLKSRTFEYTNARIFDRYQSYWNWVYRKKFENFHQSTTDDLLSFEGRWK